MIDITSSESDGPSQRSPRISTQAGEKDNPLVIMDSSDDEIPSASSPIRPPLSSPAKTRQKVLQTPQRSVSDHQITTSARRSPPTLDTPPAVRPLLKYPKARKSGQEKVLPGATKPLDLTNREKSFASVIELFSSEEAEDSTRMATETSSPNRKGKEREKPSTPSSSPSLNRVRGSSPSIPSTSGSAARPKMPAVPMARKESSDTTMDFAEDHFDDMVTGMDVFEMPVDEVQDPVAVDIAMDTELDRPPEPPLSSDTTGAHPLNMVSPQKEANTTRSANTTHTQGSLTKTPVELLLTLS